MEDIKRQWEEKIAEGISHIRKGEVQCIPGFDESTEDKGYETLR